MDEWLELLYANGNTGYRENWLETLANVDQIFRNMIRTAVNSITMNPEAQNVGVWNVVEGLNAALVAIGSSLIVLFFLIGFCKSSIDAKRELRLNNVLKMLLRLGIANALVIFNINIIRALIGSVSALINGISSQLSFYTSDGSWIAEDETLKRAISSPTNGFDSLTGDLLLLIFMLVIIACGVIIVYFAVIRCIKIYTIIPFGAIALATFASDNRDVSMTGVNYVKYVLSTLIEAAIMLVGLKIVFELWTHPDWFPLLNGATDTDTTLYLLILYIAKMSVIAILGVGAMKGAMTVVHKAFGL